MELTLGLDLQTLAAHYAADTAREINHQPQKWRAAFAQVEAARIAINDFLQPILSKPNLRIIFTGAGTSAFAGKVVAPCLTSVCSRLMEAVSTTDLVSNPLEYLTPKQPSLLVSFARSGNSPESVAAVELVSQLVEDSYHLVLTCNPEGALAKAAQQDADKFCLLMPEGTNDKSFAMTSSFTSMVLTALTVFNPKINQHHVDKFCHSSKQLLDESLAKIRNLAALPIERVVYLGSGVFTGLAQESALKLLELTAGQIVSVYDSTLGFRHGPKSIVNDKTLIVQYLSSDVYTRQYDVDLLNELVRDNKAAHILAVSAKAHDLHNVDCITVGEFAEDETVLLSFPFIVLAQLFAFFKALHLGITPDNPCPTGEVNRVVQGVTIHPFSTFSDQ